MLPYLKTSREVVIIAAVAENGVIGNQGRIPWWDDVELRREDMRHFRKLTLGKSVIMGYSTFQSLGKLLPDRLNIILSRKEGLYIPGASVCSDLDSALFVGHTFHPEVCVIGGGELYREALSHATRLEITEIQGRYQGDVFFPSYKNTREWGEVVRQPQEGFAFV